MKKNLRLGIIYRAKKDCLPITCRCSLSFYLISALGYKFPEDFEIVQKGFQLSVEKNVVFLRIESLPRPRMGYTAFFLPEVPTNRQNTQNCERETKRENFGGFVMIFNWVPLPTCMVLALHLDSPVVCVYVKDNQLPVCFSTGSYQETDAACCFQMASL